MESSRTSLASSRRVARIWKRGGLFWKSEKCANDLDSNFHWPWISFRRFVRNLRRNVSERSEIQRFFPPKIRWSPKKKKKRSSPIFRVIFRPKSKIHRFFPPKIRWSPKKRSSPKFRAIFLPKFRKFKRLRGGSFRMGGAIFHFLQKIDLKSTKNMRFCILHNPMGGARAPPAPPLATLLASRTDFEVLGLGLEGQVLGLGLEASSPRKLACPWLENSSIFLNC